MVWNVSSTFIQDTTQRILPTQAQTAREAWQEEVGELNSSVVPVLPIMASEDFSYYLEAIPGAFALIGANDGEHHNYPCHSAYYDFNDRLLENVVRWYARLAGVSTPAITQKNMQATDCTGGKA